MCVMHICLRLAVFMYVCQDVCVWCLGNQSYRMCFAKKKSLDSMKILSLSI